ncbi:diaminopropionate ammonia-lyase [Anaerotignum lactatifermentans]|uniref:Diaminopropionate ammonia-lyase n=1 Tax=Anaerotignum lactatifermentans TaxID=160404 RepID=A0ABS2GBP4_9FIRM|nr:diaminopropionate ammonia-lyase [Anaerotignum lactatifermentans]MBM6829852.1 diaminopropionate ammonia-lyase [Anaerotignum lactatifermentans]MBM6878208.1 diaminopropionate ammonia-lyase [Anaerotignum lactatifermentans]MBM6951288.1 diaminopropionate ammonia-lyase [Anaerotignum lactatifermentans]
MERKITWTKNGIGVIEKEKTVGAVPPDFLAEDVVECIAAFHASVPGYEATPLAELPELAKKLGVGRIFVKDESKRFGLNAFKGLGGIYAVSKVICEKLGVPLTSFEEICTEENKEKIKDMVFITATDGNHGKGVAWAARKFGCKAYVYMPKGTVECRAEAIREIGAEEVLVTDCFYDDTVRMADERARKNGWTMVQDTAWEGYMDIPTYIVQGYSTLAKEAAQQLEEAGVSAPDVLFLQAGVGAFAGGVLGYFANHYGEKLPKTVIAEPDTVACIFESARVNDGNPHPSTGSCETVMAGLNCAEPCLVTYPTLRDFPAAYAACPDFVTEQGMAALGLPQGSDPVVVSGESGAVGVGLLWEIMTNAELAELRAHLGLKEDAVVLCISTEGNTDPDHYKEVMETYKNRS